MIAKTILQSARHDLQSAIRSIRKHPGFSLLVILMLAVGISADTTIFSVIRAVLLKPLPYHDSDRIVMIADGATPIRFAHVKAASRSYEEVGAYTNGLEHVALSGNGQPEVLDAARVSANFLSVLGVAPAVGRGFLDQEDRDGAPAVAMISTGLWQRKYGADRAVIGKAINLAGAPHTIVGILPAGFEFPMKGVDVWLTRPSEWSIIPPFGRPLSPILSIFGRLRHDVTSAAATSELAVLNRQYAAANPGMLDMKDPQVTDPVRPLKEVLVEDVRAKLWMLFGAVGFVLLIVCANTGGMMLARTVGRTREFAVRAAIGAGRGRIVRQLLAESLLLSLTGGAIGIALTAASLSVVRNISLVDLPRASSIHLDATVLIFGIAASALVGIIFGLAPAVTSSKVDLATALRGSGEVAASSKPNSILGALGLLVVGQVTLSIVLVISASLLIESMVHLSGVYPGFQPSGLLTMKVSPSPTRYDTEEKRGVFYQQLVEHAAAVPGVTNAGLTLTVPMDEFMGTTVQVSGRPLASLNDRPIAIIQNVTSSYFQTMRIPIVRGREFNSHDNKSSTDVAIVSEGFAKTFWPEYPNGPDPIGQTVLSGSELRPHQIVGIAGDVHHTGRDQQPRPEIYYSTAQEPPQSAMLVVRTTGDPLSLSAPIRNAILQLDRDQPVSQISTMNEIIESSEGQLTLMLRLLGIFAAVAMGLALLGLYGVISYSVVRRTREIGIRRALGAQNRDLIYLLLKRGFMLVGSGVAVGLGTAVLVTRLLQDLLFHVSPTDPLTFAVIAAVFLLVAIGASLIPALRTTEIEPLIAIRAE
jgi:putative ABC transport system permease protein